MPGRFNASVFPGAKFGRLTVIRRLTKEESGGRSKVKCLCSCGMETITETTNLPRGTTTSCGCRKKEVGKENAKKRVKPGVGYGKVFAGAVFGRLTVIKRIRNKGRDTSRVKCVCECGVITTKTCIDGLVGGAVNSCGCLKSDLTRKRNKEHAKFGCYSSTHPRTFQTWHSMYQRCYDKNCKSYETYGKRGVVMCQFLKEDPRHFAKIVGIRKNTKPSIDRFPIHNGNYTCGQCSECKQNGWELNIRWATRKQQSENRGEFNVRLTAFGKTLLLSQWEELSGMNGNLIHNRIKKGWSVEKALTTPNKKGCCYNSSGSIVV